MVKVLIKIQLYEIFRSYFYDAKNNKKRSVASTVAFIVLFVGIIFKAQTAINDLVMNVGVYGMKVKDSAYVFYLFGRIGEGDPLAMISFTAGIGALCALTCYAMSRSFLKIVTSSGRTDRIVYKESKAKQRGERAALLSKEFARFTSSANYMLNCGLGSLFFVIIGILLLVKRRVLLATMAQLFTDSADSMVCIFLVVIACAMVSMNDMVVPSVSLEGKSLWILQSVPVRVWNVLKAKLGVQLIVTAVPLLFYDICILFVMEKNVPKMIVSIVVPILFLFFMDFFGLLLAIVRPNFTWTNEIAPIKQSLNVMIAMFGGWVLTAAIVASYLMAGYKLGVTVYLVIISVVLLALVIVLFLWIKKVGTRIFSEFGQ